nr:hypothetical protein [Tanacetum cinerariifolium]
MEKLEDTAYLRLDFTRNHEDLKSNTIGSDNQDANEHNEKVLEIVDLFLIPEDVILFYKGLDVPTRHILDSKGAIPTMKVVDAKVAIQEMADHSQKWHNGTSTRAINFVVLDMPEGIKVLLILGRPFLSTAHVKIDVFKRKITLRVGDVKIVFKSDKLASSVIKRVYALGLRERMKLDLEARLMREALILKRSQDPNFEDFLEQNDLDEPLELRRIQVKDLGPTIKDGDVIDNPWLI